jgi:teichuronic acid biosynthesis glycosyltransferase TuaH
VPSTHTRDKSQPEVPVVILSTADFDADVWTNKQHLAVELSKTRRVLYIESLGLRTPRFCKADLLRILARILHRTRRAGHYSRSIPDNIEIISPRVLPWHSLSCVAAINSRILRRMLKRKIQDYSGAVLWTFSPVTYGLEKSFKHTVYHSVDLLHVFPGVPHDLLLERERELIPLTSSVIASSRMIANHLKRQGAKKVTLWENVAHVDMFATSGGQRDNVAIFAGNLTSTKIDFALLEQVAEVGVKLRLAGPMGIDGAGVSEPLQKLLSNKNVEYLGNLELETLASEVKKCKVGLIPYHLNEYTLGVYPMKVHEYLAAGLKVVSTRLPSLDALRLEGLILASPKEFRKEVISGLEEYSEEDASVRKRMSINNSWATRKLEAESLLKSFQVTE